MIWGSGGILNFLFSGRHASLIAGVHCGPGAFRQYRSAIFTYPGRKGSTSLFSEMSFQCYGVVCSLLALSVGDFAKLTLP